MLFDQPTNLPIYQSTILLKFLPLHLQIAELGQLLAEEERDHAGPDHVDDTRAGEVDRTVAQPEAAAQVLQPAAAPDPTADQ